MTLHFEHDNQINILPRKKSRKLTIEANGHWTGCSLFQIETVFSVENYI